MDSLVLETITSDLELLEEQTAFSEMDKQPEIAFEDAVSVIKEIPKELLDLSRIYVVRDSVTQEQSVGLKQICQDYFETTFLPRLVEKGYERPLDKKYGNVIERKRGRFEIIPPKDVVDSLWSVLRENPVFSAVNQRIREEIQKGNPLSEKCVEEIGILPIEPRSDHGYWHRDVFFREPADYQREPFYITQVIYLDEKASTEFCVGSRNNPNNNFTKYDRKTIAAENGSSVFFDGRHLHRGLANETEETRYALYISYYECSYVDREHVLDLFE